LRHAFEFGSGANSRIFADAGLVKAGRAIALVQNLLVRSLEQTVGHFVPKMKIEKKIDSYSFIF
jgi:hypothetical protein